MHDGLAHHLLKYNRLLIESIQTHFPRIISFEADGIKAPIEL
jgi:hypothetical protein